MSDKSDNLSVFASDDETIVEMPATRSNTPPPSAPFPQPSRSPLHLPVKRPCARGRARASTKAQAAIDVRPGGTPSQAANNVRPGGAPSQAAPARQPQEMFDVAIGPVNPPPHNRQYLERSARPPVQWIPPAANTCNFCRDPNHNSHRCPRLIPLNAEQRYELVLEYLACENCLGSHPTLACKSPNRCQHCGLEHHTTLHEYFASEAHRLRQATEGAAALAERRLQEIINRNTQRREADEQRYNELTKKLEAERTARANLEAEVNSLRRWRQTALDTQEELVRERNEILADRNSLAIQLLDLQQQSQQTHQNVYNTPQQVSNNFAALSLPHQPPQPTPVQIPHQPPQPIPAQIPHPPPQAHYQHPPVSSQPNNPPCRCYYCWVAQGHQ